MDKKTFIVFTLIIALFIGAAIHDHMPYSLYYKTLHKFPEDKQKAIDQQIRKLNKEYKQFDKQEFLDALATLQEDQEKEDPLRLIQFLPDIAKFATLHADELKRERELLLYVADKLFDAINPSTGPIVSSEQFKHNLNIIGEMLKDSRASFSDLLWGLSHVTDSARVAKVEFEEIAGAMKVMTDNGINVDNAGESLDDFIDGFQRTYEGTENALKSLGFNVKQFSDVGKDRELDLKPLSQIIEMINKKMENLHLSNERRSQIVGALAGEGNEKAIEQLFQHPNELVKLTNNYKRLDQY